MYVRALFTFNHGGFCKMENGEFRDIEDELAKTLIHLELVEKNMPSHKKMKIKKNK